MISANGRGPISLYEAETLQLIRGRHTLSPRVAQMLAIILCNAAKIDEAGNGTLELHFKAGDVQAHFNQRLALDFRDAPG